jgi:hypothetical protein
MAEKDIVGGMFGITPEMYQRNIAARDTATNASLAGLTPGQLAGFYAMEAGTGLGRATGSLLGVEDPELAKIRDVQQMRTQFDVSTPTGLRSFAQALGQKGYTDLAVKATEKAADIDKTIAEAEAKRTDKIKQVGLSDDGRQVYQSGTEQFILGPQGKIPYYGKLESKQTKTEITGLDKVFDKAFTIAEGKDQAEAWKTAGIAYQDASKVNRNLREMESVVGSAFVGPYGSLKAGVSRVFGGGKRLSDTEVLDALSAELVIPMAKLFPGSLAVKELQELIKTKPNVSQSEPTILRLINKIQQDVKAGEITYEAGERYRAKNEGKIQGFNPNIANNRATRFVEIEQKLKKNRATNPNYMLSAEETKEAEKIATELSLK